MRLSKSKTSTKFEMPSSKRDAAVWRARFFTPPCFWCCFVLNSAVHYTILFDICQMLNKINYEDTKFF